MRSAKLAKVRHNGALCAALRLPSRGAYFNQYQDEGSGLGPLPQSLLLST
jgi:hypothetical protein